MHCAYTHRPLSGRLSRSYRENDLVLLDIKINSEPVEPLAAIVHRDNAYYVSCARLPPLLLLPVGGQA